MRYTAKIQPEQAQELALILTDAYRGEFEFTTSDDDIINLYFNYMTVCISEQTGLVTTYIYNDEKLDDTPVPKPSNFVNYVKPSYVVRKYNEDGDIPF